MNNKWATFSILVLMMLSSSIVYAITETKQVTLHLDKDADHFVAVEVNFPPNFYELEPSDPGITFYIPINEKPNNWTQQIELQEFPRNDMFVDNYVNQMKGRMQKEFPSFKILNEKNESFKDYKSSEFTASITQDNKAEIIIARFFKSLDTLAGYIYRKKIAGEITEDILKSEKQFVDTHMIVHAKGQ